METEQKTKLYDMLPVITFISSYFLLHLFDWMEATQVFIAALVGSLTMFMMISECKEENKDKIRKADLKSINFYVGILSLLLVLFLANGILHWNRMIDYAYRMGILFFLVLMYLVFLFRTIRILSDLKKSLNK
ncbi:MAG: hypothetical protein JW956_06415 [Calditrichaceae bacterium]|nr:hypothetical protein [Calditrichaceae bacterium]